MVPLATGLYFEAPRWHKDRLWFVDAPARSVCPNCQTVKLPHVVCPNCGWYKGRQAIEVQ